MKIDVSMVLYNLNNDSGECRSSQDSVMKADWNSESKGKAENCFSDKKCDMEWPRDVKVSDKFSI